jgi:hypothetical protein
MGVVLFTISLVGRIDVVEATYDRSKPGGR